MSLATALLQPRITRREAPDAEAALAEDVFRLAALVAEDLAAEGPIAAALEAAVLAMGPRVQAGIEARVPLAQARVRRLLREPRAYLDRLVSATAAVGDDPSAILAVVRGLMQDVRALAEGLTLSRLRTHLGVVKSLVEDDLGLSPATVAALTLALLDELIERLAAAAPDEPVAARRRRRLAAAIVARLRLRLADHTPPGFDIEALARLIARLLRDSGIRAALAEVACAVDALEAALDAAVAAGRAVRPQPLPAGAGVVPLANASEYCWYASWLLADEDLPLLGLSDLERPARLVLALQRADTPLTAYLRSQLSEAQRADIDAHAGPTAEPEQDLLRTILGVVNRLMQDEVLLRHAGGTGAFAEDALPGDIRSLRDKHVDDQKLILFNRRVLEHAFGGDLATAGGETTRWLVRMALGTVGLPRHKPRHQVYVTADRRFVMCDDMPIHIGENLRWFDAAMFKQARPGGLWFDFEHIGPEACEILAQIFHTTGDAGKAIWHLVELQPGHEAQAATIGAIEIAVTLQEILFGKPLSGHLVDRSEGLRRFGRWADSGVGLRGLATFATSFQGTIGRDDNDLAVYWLTVFLGDVFRTLKPIADVNMLRDLMLCFITLLNFRGPRDAPSTLPSNPAANHRQQDAIVALFQKLFAMLLHAQYDRDNYSILLWTKGGIGDRRRDAMLRHWLGGSIGLGLVAGATGSVVAQIIAWAEDWQRLFRTMGESVLKMFFGYWVLNYLYVENSTDSGRYRPGGGAFRGYPDPARAPSPYRLPMPAGTARYVGQANQGLFSHNLIANRDFVNPANSAPLQTYAYDFDHAFREGIACVRDGTVFNVAEGQLDSGSDQNTLTIQHSTIDPVHDDFGNGPVQTYSVYVHLAHNGVTNAPLFGGTTPAVGTPVSQGDIIALAGDTGKSAHNHLHLHVVPDDGTGNPATFTVPFVFEDVGGDGVPRSITWYRSGSG
jgi:hypothetical protein